MCVYYITCIMSIIILCSTDVEVSSMMYIPIIMLRERENELEVLF